MMPPEEEQRGDDQPGPEIEEDYIDSDVEVLNNLRYSESTEKAEQEAEELADDDDEAQSAQHFRLDADDSPADQQEDMVSENGFADSSVQQPMHPLPDHNEMEEEQDQYQEEEYGQEDEFSEDGAPTVDDAAASPPATEPLVPVIPANGVNYAEPNMEDGIADLRMADPRRAQVFENALGPPTPAVEHQIQSDQEEEQLYTEIPMSAMKESWLRNALNCGTCGCKRYFEPADTWLLSQLKMAPREGSPVHLCTLCVETTCFEDFEGLVTLNRAEFDRRMRLGPKWDPPSQRRQEEARDQQRNGEQEIPIYPVNTSSPRQNLSPTNRGRAPTGNIESWMRWLKVQTDEISCGRIVWDLMMTMVEDPSAETPARLFNSNEEMVHFCLTTENGAGAGIVPHPAKHLYAANGYLYGEALEWALNAISHGRLSLLNVRSDAEGEIRHGDSRSYGEPLPLMEPPRDECCILLVSMNNTHWNLVYNRPVAIQCPGGSERSQVWTLIEPKEGSADFSSYQMAREWVLSHVDPDRPGGVVRLVHFPSSNLHVDRFGRTIPCPRDNDPDRWRGEFALWNLEEYQRLNRNGGCAEMHANPHNRREADATRELEQVLEQSKAEPSAYDRDMQRAMRESMKTHREESTDRIAPSRPGSRPGSRPSSRPPNRPASRPTSRPSSRPPLPKKSSSVPLMAHPMDPAQRSEETFPSMSASLSVKVPKFAKLAAAEKKSVLNAATGKSENANLSKAPSTNPFDAKNSGRPTKPTMNSSRNPFSASFKPSMISAPTRPTLPAISASVPPGASHAGRSGQLPKPTPNAVPPTGPSAAPSSTVPPQMNANAPTFVPPTMNSSSAPTAPTATVAPALSVGPNQLMTVQQYQHLQQQQEHRFELERQRMQQFALAMTQQAVQQVSASTKSTEQERVETAILAAKSVALTQKPHQPGNSKLDEGIYDLKKATFAEFTPGKEGSSKARMRALMDWRLAIRAQWGDHWPMNGERLAIWMFEMAWDHYCCIFGGEKVDKVMKRLIVKFDKEWSAPLKDAEGKKLGLSDAERNFLTRIAEPMRKTVPAKVKMDVKSQWLPATFTDSVPAFKRLILEITALFENYGLRPGSDYDSLIQQLAQCSLNPHGTGLDLKGQLVSWHGDMELLLDLPVPDSERELGERQILAKACSGVYSQLVGFMYSNAFTLHLALSIVQYWDDEGLEEQPYRDLAFWKEVYALLLEKVSVYTAHLRRHPEHLPPRRAAPQGTQRRGLRVNADPSQNQQQQQQQQSHLDGASAGVGLNASSGDVHEELLLPKKYIGQFMGQGGDVVRRMQQRSKVIIDVPRDRSADPIVVKLQATSSADIQALRERLATVDYPKWDANLEERANRTGTQQQQQTQQQHAQPHQQQRQSPGGKGAKGKGKGKGGADPKSRAKAKPKAMIGASGTPLQMPPPSVAGSDTTTSTRLAPTSLQELRNAVDFGSLSSDVLGEIAEAFFVFSDNRQNQGGLMARNSLSEDDQASRDNLLQFLTLCPRDSLVDLIDIFVTVSHVFISKEGQLPALAYDLHDLPVDLPPVAIQMLGESHKCGQCGMQYSDGWFDTRDQKNYCLVCHPHMGADDGFVVPARGRPLMDARRAHAMILTGAVMSIIDFAADCDITVYPAAYNQLCDFLISTCDMIPTVTNLLIHIGTAMLAFEESQTSVKVSQSSDARYKALVAMNAAGRAMNARSNRPHGKDSIVSDRGASEMCLDERKDYTKLPPTVVNGKSLPVIEVRRQGASARRTIFGISDKPIVAHRGTIRNYIFHGAPVPCTYGPFSENLVPERWLIAVCSVWEWTMKEDSDGVKELVALLPNGQRLDIREHSDGLLYLPVSAHIAISPSISGHVYPWYEELHITRQHVAFMASSNRDGGYLPALQAHLQAMATRPVMDSDSSSSTLSRPDDFPVPPYPFRIAPHPPSRPIQDAHLIVMFMSEDRKYTLVAQSAHDRIMKLPSIRVKKDESFTQAAHRMMQQWKFVFDARSLAQVRAILDDAIPAEQLSNVDGSIPMSQRSAMDIPQEDFTRANFNDNVATMNMHNMNRAESSRRREMQGLVDKGCFMAYEQTPKNSKDLMSDEQHHPSFHLFEQRPTAVPYMEAAGRLCDVHPFCVQWTEKEDFYNCGVVRIMISNGAQLVSCMDEVSVKEWFWWPVNSVMDLSSVFKPQQLAFYYLRMYAEQQMFLPDCIPMPSSDDSDTSSYYMPGVPGFDRNERGDHVISSYKAGEPWLEFFPHLSDFSLNGLAYALRPEIAREFRTEASDDPFAADFYTTGFLAKFEDTLLSAIAELGFPARATYLWALVAFPWRCAEILADPFMDRDPIFDEYAHRFFERIHQIHWIGGDDMAFRSPLASRPVPYIPQPASTISTDHETELETFTDGLVVTWNAETREPSPPMLPTDATGPPMVPLILTSITDATPFALCPLFFELGHMSTSALSQSLNFGDTPLMEQVRQLLQLPEGPIAADMFDRIRVRIWWAPGAAPANQQMFPVAIHRATVSHCLCLPEIDSWGCWLYNPYTNQHMFQTETSRCLIVHENAEADEYVATYTYGSGPVAEAGWRRRRTQDVPVHVFSAMNIVYPDDTLVMLPQTNKWDDFIHQSVWYTMEAPLSGTERVLYDRSPPVVFLIQSANSRIIFHWFPDPVAKFIFTLGGAPWPVDPRTTPLRAILHTEVPEPILHMITEYCGRAPIGFPAAMQVPAIPLDVYVPLPHRQYWNDRNPAYRLVGIFGWRRYLAQAMVEFWHNPVTGASFVRGYMRRNFECIDENGVQSLLFGQNTCKDVINFEKLTVPMHDIHPLPLKLFGEMIQGHALCAREIPLMEQYDPVILPGDPPPALNPGYRGRSCYTHPVITPIARAELRRVGPLYMRDLPVTPRARPRQRWYQAHDHDLGVELHAAGPTNVDQITTPRTPGPCPNIATIECNETIHNHSLTSATVRGRQRRFNIAWWPMLYLLICCVMLPVQSAVTNFTWFLQCGTNLEGNLPEQSSQSLPALVASVPHVQQLGPYSSFWIGDTITRDDEEFFDSTSLSMELRLRCDIAIPPSGKPMIDVLNWEFPDASGAYPGRRSRADVTVVCHPSLNYRAYATAMPRFNSLHACQRDIYHQRSRTVGFPCMASMWVPSTTSLPLISRDLFSRKNAEDLPAPIAKCKDQILAISNAARQSLGATDVILGCVAPGSETTAVNSLFFQLQPPGPNSTTANCTLLRMPQYHRLSDCWFVIPIYNNPRGHGTWVYNDCIIATKNEVPEAFGLDKFSVRIQQRLAARYELPETARAWILPILSTDQLASTMHPAIPRVVYGPHIRLVFASTEEESLWHAACHDKTVEVTDSENENEESRDAWSYGHLKRATPCFIQSRMENRIARTVVQICRHGRLHDDAGWVTRKALQEKSEMNAELIAEMWQELERYSGDRLEVCNSKIRAINGHSPGGIAIDMHKLYHEDDSKKDIFHATTAHAAERILREGISAMNRDVIHAFTNIKSAQRKGGKQGVILRINTKKIRGLGMTVFRTQNGKRSDMRFIVGDSNIPVKALKRIGSEEEQRGRIEEEARESFESEEEHPNAVAKLEEEHCTPAQINDEQYLAMSEIQRAIHDMSIAKSMTRAVSSNRSEMIRHHQIAIEEHECESVMAEEERQAEDQLFMGVDIQPTQDFDTVSVSEAFSEILPYAMDDVDWTEHDNVRSAESGRAFKALKDAWPENVRANVEKLVKGRGQWKACSAAICTDGHRSESCQLCRQGVIKPRYHRSGTTGQDQHAHEPRAQWDLVSLHFGKTTISTLLCTIVEEWVGDQKTLWRVAVELDGKGEDSVRNAAYQTIMHLHHVCGCDVVTVHGDREKSMTKLANEFRRTMAINLTFSTGSDPVGLGEGNNRWLLDRSKKSISHISDPSIKRWLWAKAMMYEAWTYNMSTMDKLPAERTARVRLSPGKVVPFGTLVVAAGRPKDNSSKTETKGFLAIYLGVKPGSTDQFEVARVIDKKYKPGSDRVRISTSKIITTTAISPVVEDQIDKKEGPVNVVVPDVYDPVLITKETSFFDCVICGMSHQVSPVTARQIESRRKKNPNFMLSCEHFKDRQCGSLVEEVSVLKRGNYVDDAKVKEQKTVKCEKCKIIHQVSHRAFDRLTNKNGKPIKGICCNLFSGRQCRQERDGTSKLKPPGRTPGAAGRAHIASSLPTESVRELNANRQVNIVSANGGGLLDMPGVGQKGRYRVASDIFVHESAGDIKRLAKKLGSHEKIEEFASALEDIVRGRTVIAPCNEAECKARPDLCHQDVIHVFIRKAQFEPMIISNIVRRMHAHLDHNADEQLGKYHHPRLHEIDSNRTVSNLFYEVNVPSMVFVTRHADKVETKTPLAVNCRKAEMKGLVDKNCIKEAKHIDELANELAEFAKRNPGVKSKDMVCHAMILTGIKNDEVLQRWFEDNLGADYASKLPRHEFELNLILQRAFDEIEEKEKHKPDASKATPKFKGRFVLRGDRIIRPQDGEDLRDEIRKMTTKHGYLQNVSAPVTSQRGFRASVALSLLTGYQAESADLEQFFIQEKWPIPETAVGRGRLFIKLTPKEISELPEHLHPPKNSNWNDYVFRCGQCLYGHDLSCRLAGMGLSRHLHKMKFQRMKSEAAIYVQWRDDGSGKPSVVFVITYVDDISVVGSKKNREWFWKELQQRYSVPDAGLVTRYVGTNVDYQELPNQRIARLHQSEYAAEIVRAYQEKVDLSAFPLKADGKKVMSYTSRVDPRPDSKVVAGCTKEAEEGITGLQHRQELLGMLGWYARCVRPDMLFTVAALQQRTHSWCRDCNRCLADLIDYVQASKTAGIQMTYQKGEKGLRVVIFSDADLHAPKSQTGMFLAIVGANGTYIPLDFSSTKQSPVSNSTPMAETIAGATNVQNQLLFATELQQIIEAVEGKVPYTQWNSLSPTRIPLMVDAKELERQAVQPMGKTICSLCAGLARDQMTWLAQDKYLQIRWLKGILNPSDIGTKQHETMVVLRALCGVYMDLKAEEEKWAKNPELAEETKLMIKEVMDAVTVERQEMHEDIDFHLRAAWEIDDPTWDAISSIGVPLSDYTRRYGKRKQIRRE